MAETGAVLRQMRHGVVKARRQAATTPGRLRTLSLAIAIMAALLMLVGAASLIAALVTVADIQQRNVPAITGMQHIRAWLVDADRSAANAYLAGSSSSSLDQLQFAAESAATNVDPLGHLSPDDPQLRYEADIAAASHGLLTATEQSGSDTEVTQRLQAIAAAVADYTQIVQTADASEAQDPVAGYIYLQVATSSMHSQGGILAQVDAARALYIADLDQANLRLQIITWMVVLYVVVAVVLLWLLVDTQRFVRVRFRRRRNNRLLAATVLLLMLSAGGGVGVAGAGESIRSAENQTYARLANLWSARSLAYDANDNEILSLIARGNGAQFDQRFQADSAQLVDRPLTGQLIQDAERGQVRFNGLLADELRAAGSAQEGEPALQALLAYQKYLAADATVRASAAQGHLRLSAASGLGPYQDLLSSFSRLDWYLGASIQLLQRQFDATMGRAETVLAATAAFEVLAVAIAGLTFWGLRPRIGEYTVGADRRQVKAVGA